MCSAAGEAFLACTVKRETTVGGGRLTLLTLVASDPPPLICAHRH